MADEHRTSVPAKVSMSELESEFGMEGNTPAADSDARVEEAAGKSAGLEGMAALDENKEIDTRTIESHIKREELIKDLDDNLEIMAVDEKLSEEGESEGADDDGEESGDDDGDGAADDDEGGSGKDPATGDDDAEDVGGDGGEDGEGDRDGSEGDGEGEDDRDDEGGAGDGSGFDDWLNEHLSDPADRSEMAQALLRSGAEVTYRVDGKDVTEPLSKVIERANSAVGYEKVQATAREAADHRKTAESTLAQAKALEKTVQEQMEALSGEIEDPERFATFVVGNANLEYLKTLHGRLDEAIAKAEDDPMGFELGRRMSGLEGMVRQLSEAVSSTQGTPPATGTASNDGGKREDDGGARSEPSKVPDDLGFIRGKGYPTQYTDMALREANAALKAAQAVGLDRKVTMQDVVKRWNESGRSEPITDVISGLLGQVSRDSRKRTIAADPPNRRKPKSGRPRSGGKRPGGDSAAEPKEPKSWDDIEAAVAAELKAANEGAELAS